MSAEVMERVRMASGQTDGSLCLLLVLAEEADADGVCWLGRKRLARRLGLSERETVELIRALEAAGELCLIPAGEGSGEGQVYVVAPGLGEAELTLVLYERFGFDPEEAGRAARRVIANRVRARYGLGRRRGENRTPRGDSGVPWGAARDPRLSEVDDQRDIPDMRGDFYDPTGVMGDLGGEVSGTTGSLDEPAPWGDFYDPGGVTWNSRGHIPGTIEIREGGDSYDPTGVMRDPWGHISGTTEIREGGDSYDPTGVMCDPWGHMPGTTGVWEGALWGDSYDPTGVILGGTGVIQGQRGVKSGHRGVIAMSPEPPKEPLKEPSLEPSQEPPPPYPPPPRARAGTERQEEEGGQGFREPVQNLARPLRTASNGLRTEGQRPTRKGRRQVRWRRDGGAGLPAGGSVRGRAGVGWDRGARSPPG